MQLIIYLYALQWEGLDRYRQRIEAELHEIVPAGVLYVPAVSYTHLDVYKRPVSVYGVTVRRSGL